MTSCRAWPGSQETRPPQLRGPGSRARGPRETPASRAPPASPRVGRHRTLRFLRTPPPPGSEGHGEGGGRGRGWGGRSGRGEGPLASRLLSPACPPRHPPGPGRAALARPPAEPGAGAGPGSGCGLLRPLRAPGPRCEASAWPQVPPLLAGAAVAAGAHRSTFLSPAKRVGAARAWRAGGLACAGRGPRAGRARGAGPESRRTPHLRRALKPQGRERAWVWLRTGSQVTEAWPGKTEERE